MKADLGFGGFVSLEIDPRSSILKSIRLIYILQVQKDIVW